MNRAEILESLRKYILPERAQRIHEAAIERTRLIKVVIEDIYQDNNAGAVFRTCDCFGIQEATVIENRYLTKVAQSISKGSEKWLNTNKFDQQNTNNTVACINDLKSNGYLVVATTPHNPDVLLPDFELTQKTAIIFGTEGKGLTQDALDLADVKLKVPIYGFTESFNISVSAALVLQDLTTKLRKSKVNWQLPENERIELEIDWIVKSMGRTGVSLLNQFSKSA